MKYDAVVSMGDPNSIAAEILLKYHQKYPEISLHVCGAGSVFKYWSEKLDLPFSFYIDDTQTDFTPDPRIEHADAGALSREAVIRGYKKARELSLPLVTLPVSKKAISYSDPGFTGHTELLASLDNKDVVKDIAMMLGGENMKVVTITRHIPLSSVSESLTFDLIVKQITLAHQWFVNWKGRNPSIWMCGLNPHAGEQGEIGTEEIDTIIPAIDFLKQQGISVAGPFPADTMFHFGLKEKIDILVCCYHDQGLTPLKLVHFEDGVNATLGLSIIRTSVDHGTAFNIAGKNKADIESFSTAMRWGIEMNQRKIES